MINLSQHKLSHKEIVNLLQSKWLPLKQYRLDLIRNGSRYRSLQYESCSLRCDSQAEVKYGGKAVTEYFDINPNTDMIQPVIYVKYENLYEFKLVPLRILAANRTIKSNNIMLDMELMDSTCILQNNSIGKLLFLPKGKVYTTAIEDIIYRAGFSFINVEPSAQTILYDREDWQPGDSLLKIANDLAKEINYRGIEVGLDGMPRCRPYVLPNINHAEIKYDARNNSIILPNKSLEFDNWGKPNVFKASVFTSEMGEPITAEYINDNPIDPTSIINNPFRIVKEVTGIDNIADKQSLYGVVRRVAEETAQAFEYASLTTAIMPHHETNEVIAIDSYGINGVWEEIGWSIDNFGANGTMSHQLRRVML